MQTEPSSAEPSTMFRSRRVLPILEVSYKVPNNLIGFRDVSRAGVEHSRVLHQRHSTSTSRLSDL